MPYKRFWNVFTKWSNWSPTQGFFHHGTKVRQLGHVLEGWSPISTNHSIKLKLSLAHDFRVMKHCKQKVFGRHSSLHVT